MLTALNRHCLLTAQFAPRRYTSLAAAKGKLSAAALARCLSSWHHPAQCQSRSQPQAVFSSPAASGRVPRWIPDCIPCVAALPVEPLVSPLLKLFSSPIRLLTSSSCACSPCSCLRRVTYFASTTF